MCCASTRQHPFPLQAVQPDTDLQHNSLPVVKNTAKNSREGMPLLECFPHTIHLAKHSADVFRHIKFKIKNRISTASHWQA